MNKQERLFLAGCWCGFLYAIVLLSFFGCKTPPPDRPYAATGSVTNRAPSDELQTRNLPDLERSGRAFTNYNEMYRYYTNIQQDALIERQGILGPPVVPRHGPFPLYKSPPGVSNWMTPKAMAVQPKALITNQIPGSYILSRVTTTDAEGKKFTAELTLEGDITVRAGAKMSVVIFAIQHTNFVFEVCTNIADGTWRPLASGKDSDTNSAVALFDLHDGSRPIQFFRQRPGN